MSNIKAGVVLVTEFCKPGGNTFQGYINYIDREDAIRNEWIGEYNMYQNYMGNPEKTTGIFTDGKDMLNKEEKKQLKECFSKAQDNGSLMWQSVISFDNRWLEMNGLYDSQTKMLDEKKLHEITRSCMNQMLKDENLENAIWSAAVHYNTDNIHIHIATVEPVPTRKTMEYQGEKEYRGKFKLSSIQRGKSKVVNGILGQQKENKLINSLIRDVMVKGARGSCFIKDPDMARDFLNLHEKLPGDKRKWKYNMNALANVREEIDQLSSKFLESHFNDEMKQLKKALNIQQKKYQLAYGGKADNKYASNKIDDLYQRLGNAILNQLKEYDRQLSGLEDKEISKKNDGKDTVTEEEDYGIREEWIQGINKEPSSDRGKEGVFCKWDQNYKAAKNHLYSGKKTTQMIGLNEMTLEAKKGNALAVYDLARAYEQGIGTEKDKKQSEQLYAESLEMFQEIYQKTESGFLKSYLPYRIGKMYKQGQNIGGEKDYEQALEWFQIAAGNSFSVYEIGQSFYKGQGVEKDYEQALNCFKRAVDLSENDDIAVPYAEYQVGHMYEQGEGTEIDQDKAYEYYSRALLHFQSITDPDDKLLYRIGMMYLDGKGTDKNLDSAVAFLEDAAASNHERATYRLSLIYLNPQKATYFDPKKGIDMLERSATKGNQFAQYKLGKMYLKGEILKQDYKAAKNFLELAANQGNDLAKYELGKMHMTGEYGVEDIAKAKYWLECSAQKGNQYAQYKLATLLGKKEYGIEDYGAAVTWYEAASNQGNSFAQYSLGKMYMEGIGVKQDKVTGRRWLELSADQGNVYAQKALQYYDQAGIKRHKTSWRVGGRMGYTLDRSLRQLKKSMEKECRDFQREYEYMMGFDHQ